MADRSRHAIGGPWFHITQCALWLAIGIGGGASGCRRPDSPPASSAGRLAAVVRVDTATDVLYRLYRRQLTADNPILVGQQIVCEMVRLDSVLGPAEARRRTQQVADTVYTWHDMLARQRMQAALGGHQLRLALNGSSCTPAGLALLDRPVRDSLAVIVAREVAARRPIATSCAFRCEVLHLMGDHDPSREEIVTRLGPTLARAPVTSALDPNALIDSALTPSRPGCACQARE